jgi:hypothetical protein
MTPVPAVDGSVELLAVLLPAPSTFMTLPLHLSLPFSRRPGAAAVPGLALSGELEVPTPLVVRMTHEPAWPTAGVIAADPFLTLDAAQPCTQLGEQKGCRTCRADPPIVIPLDMQPVEPVLMGCTSYGTARLEICRTCKPSICKDAQKECA